MPTTCTRCGRTLTATRYQQAGVSPIGRTCARRVREVAAAAVELVKAETLAKAIEDVEDGAIVDTRRVTAAGRRVFAVVSSTGAGVYLATVQNCTCRGGHRGRVCRHRVAAALVAA
jgi:hypothetical protein